MSKKVNLLKVAGMSLVLLSSHAKALSFETDNITGEFNSTIGIGVGIRTQSPECDLVVTGATGSGAPSGCITPYAGIADSGDLNYKKGDAYTTYLKGTHELILNMPSDITFMARGTWIRDFSATHTSGIGSGTGAQSGLTEDAADDLRFKARLLDFWVAKSFM